MSIAGLDIGSTGAKITVVNGDGAVVHTGYRDYPVSRAAGAHEMDAGEIWATVRGLLTQAGARVKDISAIGITSFGESFVLTDKAGTPLLPTMLYTDPRGSEEVAQLSAALTDDVIFSISGVTSHPMYTLPKLMWVKRNRPDVFSAASYVFLMEDFIAFQLTGERKIDVSLATRTMGLDIRRQTWSEVIFQAAGIDMRLFSDPVPSGTAVGTLRTEIADMCGLSERTQIVVCGQDQITAAIGSGVLHPGAAANGAGTVECVTPVFEGIPEGGFLQRDHYPIVPFLGAGLYCCYAFSFTGGALLKWFVERFSGLDVARIKAEGKSVYALIEAQMQDEPTGILVLPHFAGAATPYMDPGAKGAFVNLTLSHTMPDLYRAVLEGVVYEIRVNAERLAQSGITFQSMRVSGGCARSKDWLQMKADVLNVPIERLSNDEAGTIGGIILTGLAQGMFHSFDEAVEAMVRVTQIVEPRPRMVRAYEEHYARYRELYPSIRPFAGNVNLNGTGEIQA